MNCLKKESNITSKSPLTLSGDFLETPLKIRGARGDILKILLPAILFFLWCGQADAAVLSKAPNNLGLVGYWAMNEGRGALVGDSSGFGNHATTTNMESTDWVAGRQGKSLQFDGVDEYVSVTSHSRFNNATGTISVWIKTAGDWGVDGGSGGGAQGTTIIFARTGPGGQNISNGNAIYITSVGLANPRNFNDTVTTLNITGTKDLRDSKWHNLVYVFSQTNGEANYLYVDGVLEASGNNSAAWSFNNWPIRISEDIDSTNFFEEFKGQIDEVRLYNRALSASEVAALYKSGAANLAASSANLDNNSTLGQGLVGHWTLDGADTNWGSNTTLDRSGSGNTGTMTNMSTTTSPTPGKIGQAFTFGSNGYVSINNSTSLDISGVVSYSFWAISSSSPVGNSRQIINNGDNFIFSWDHPTASFRQACVIQNNAGSYFATKITATIPTNVWNHITCVWNGSNLAVYLNGVLDTSTNHGAQTLELDNYMLAIGVGVLDASGLPSSYFSGKIDDVRIYNRALSANEVKQLYNLGQGKLNASQNKTGGSLDSGLVGLWSFNGPDISWGSNTAYDRSGQGNHGTITNMSTTTSPTPGKIGQALKFDGSNDVVNIGTSATYDNMTQFSVCAWAKPENLSIDGNVVGKRNADRGFLFFRDEVGTSCTDCYSFFVSESSTITNNRIESSTGTANNTSWTHLCSTFQANQAQGLNLYINGSSAATPVSTINIDDSGGAGSSLKIGDDDGGPAREFGGSIDEVRIYNRVLSASEIKQLYNFGR